MSILAALGSAAASALPQIAASVIPQITNSVISGIFNKTQSGQGSSSQTQSSALSGGSATQEMMQGSSYQQGSVSGIADIWKAALGTATGNNATSAAAFNQQSAQTANDIQGKAWNNANMLNIASNAISNLMNAQSQSSAMRYNSKEAELARNFQREMRATAYQDTMKDMKAAGLNPILAAGNGATSTPGASGASISSQKFNQASAAAIPSAHTASMSAMYDYGNNTAQFIQNATAAINTAKQFGYEQVAKSLESSMYQVSDSSAKTISEYAGREDGTSSSTGKTRTEKDFIPGNND